MTERTKGCNRSKIYDLKRVKDKNKRIKIRKIKLKRSFRMEVKDGKNINER